jgi:DNA invertase Pin-like site-specific DNA recombinase
MPTTKRPYVALYARVSSAKRNGRSRQKTDSQKLALRKYARERGLRNVKYLEDHATGRNVKRDNLQTILDDCRAGRCKHLVIWKMDRLARNCRDSLNLIADLLAHKVKLSVISQGIEFDDSPMSNFLIQIFSAVAELESSFISERVKAGLEVARERGQRLGAKTKDRQRAKIRKWTQNGVPVGEQAKRLGVSRQAVYSIRKRMGDAGQVGKSS